MNRFDCRLEVLPQKPAIKLKIRNDQIRFKTRELKVVINSKTGLIDKYEANGLSCLNRKAFLPIVVQDDQNSWGDLVHSFRRKIGSFKLMSKRKGTAFSGIDSGPIDSVRIIEDGPVRSVVEALFQYEDSFVCQHYKLPKQGTQLEIESRVYWNEKDKMLKLSVPLKGHEFQYLGQTAYGTQELHTDGTECVSQKWVAAVSRKSNLVVTCINNGTYSSDFSDNELRLTLLRSAGYSSHPADDDQEMTDMSSDVMAMTGDRFTPRMDQGLRVFKFWLSGGKVAEQLKRVDQQAQVKNEKPFALSFFPNGEGEKPKSLVVLSNNIVQVAAFKRAERNNDLIIRLFEPTGKARQASIYLPFCNTRKTIKMKGFEIKTLKINTKNRTFTETNLLENLARKKKT